MFHPAAPSVKVSEGEACDRSHRGESGCNALRWHGGSCSCTGDQNAIFPEHPLWRKAASLLHTWNWCASVVANCSSCSILTSRPPYVSAGTRAARPRSSNRENMLGNVWQFPVLTTCQNSLRPWPSLLQGPFHPKLSCHSFPFHMSPVNTPGILMKHPIYFACIGKYRRTFFLLVLLVSYSQVCTHTHTHTPIWICGNFSAA